MANPPLGLLGNQPTDILPNQQASPLNVLSNVPVDVVTNTLSSVPAVGSVTGSTGSLGGTSTNLLTQPVQNVAGILVDSGAKKCYKKQYQLQGDFIDIGFDFKFLTTLLIKNSSILVNFDNQPV